MSDDHPKLKDKYEIDEDYIDPPSERADVSTTEEDPDSVDFSEVEDVPSSEHTDMSYTFMLDGSGLGGTAWDHEIDMNAPQEHDGRARTRTGFDERESDDPRKWKRLSAWQEGRWGDESHYPDQGREVDQRRFLSMFSSGLDLTTYQRGRVAAVIAELNFGHMAHYSTETIILSIISLVVNEDGRWIRDEEHFKRLVRDVGASPRDIRSCRQLVRRKSDLL